ncbi:MAG TPA: hypothetical protein PLH27_14180 [bacterium]|nr:hypothetical protein [bacterium]HMW36289.1 hypothetical protein [bacterium]HNB10618.1 hypothetical protein [bacterium]HNC50134.1 hypothetical protein [bacterium]HNH28679.1 hypothetical protein [bacterium]
MPVKSYLAYPMQDQREALAQALKELPNCEIVPSDNYDVFVIVTDTSDDAQEKEIEEKLLKIENIRFLSLVSGYEDRTTTNTNMQGGLA